MYLIFKNIFRIQKSCFCNQYFLYSKKVEQELYTFWIHTCKVIRSITLFCLVPYFSKVEVEFGRACFCFPIFLSLLRLFKHGYLFYLFINGFIFYLLRSKIKWYDQRPNFFLIWLTVKYFQNTSWCLCLSRQSWSIIWFSYLVIKYHI